MEFLSNAIFSEKDDSMLGVVITSFNTSDYKNRCNTRLYTCDELVKYYPNMEPRGFKYEAGGQLFSDSNMRRIMAPSIFEYMEHECSSTWSRSQDITDLALIGVSNGGYLLQGYKNSEEYGTPVPFSSFQVSKTSFNIFARYKEDEKTFRTASLLNPEDGSARELFVAMPTTVSLGSFGDGVKVESTCTIEGTEYIVYRTVLGISPYYTDVGESFINYLAYNVAYYDIGEKVLKYMKESNDVLAPKMDLGGDKSEVEVRKQRVKPRVQVSIQHEFQDPRLLALLNAADNDEEFARIQSMFPESYVTCDWLGKLYNTKWYAEASEKFGPEAGVYASAINLMPSCKTGRLKFALELLVHRYYIGLLGPGGDNLGVVLRGGGVYGESIKRIDFWNN